MADLRSSTDKASPEYPEQTDEKGRPMTYWGGKANQSDTPRTDAEVAKITYGSRVIEGYEFARQLERELNSLRGPSREPVAYRWKWDKNLEWHYGDYLAMGRDYYAVEPLYLAPSLDATPEKP